MFVPMEAIASLDMNTPAGNQSPEFPALAAGLSAEQGHDRSLALTMPGSSSADAMRIGGNSIHGKEPRN